MRALIDGDIIAYRCAASCEPSKKKEERGVFGLEPCENALNRVDDLMSRILNDTGADEYMVFLSSEDNYRKKIDPEYKANRKGKVDPTWLQQCRERLIVAWKAVLAVGYEADDAIGINHGPNTVICSIDKDFKQLPGLHYNFVKSEFFTVSEIEAGRFLYKLLLVGDTSDNIIGVAGIGKVKADRICEQFENVSELHTHVRHLYGDDERFDRNFTLCRILRDEAEYNIILEIFDENSLSESEGAEPTEASSTETLSPFLTVNS